MAIVDTKVETPAPAPAAAAPAPAPAAAPASAPAAQPAPAEGEPKPGEQPKPADDKTGGEKKDDTILGGDKKPSEEKPEVKQGAPEQYADFKLPEGMTLDKDMTEKAKSEFKAMGLSQEQAQKLVTLQAENAKALNDATLADYQKQVDGWKDSSVKLYGAKSGEQFAVAAQAINRFGTPELRAVLNETGLGNHPELVKFFVQVGHAIKEDSPADGRKVGEKLSDADVFFPSMKRK